MKKSTLTLLMMLTLLSFACIPAGAAAADGPEASMESLLGTYAFEEQLYMNPLSSFLATKGFREYYSFSENAFVTTDFEGRRRRLEVTYQEAPVDEAAFRESFMPEGFEIPDLSAYQNRRLYTITDESDPNRYYQLYQLDSELWLAQVHHGEVDGRTFEYVWSIYKIKRFQGDLPLQTWLYGTKDGVNDFLALQADFVSGYEHDECFNITPGTLRIGSGYSVFKYNQSCASFLLYDNGIYPMGEWFGGYGVTSMAQADLNRDGLFELYFTYSFGSGLHRSSAACFDPAAKAIVPLQVADPHSDPQVIKVLGSSIQNGEMIVAPNLQGGLSLYSAAAADMRSFVEMAFTGTDLLYTIAGMAEPAR